MESTSNNNGKECSIVISSLVGNELLSPALIRDNLYQELKKSLKNQVGIVRTNKFTNNDFTNTKEDIKIKSRSNIKFKKQIKKQNFSQTPSSIMFDKKQDEARLKKR